MATSERRVRVTLWALRITWMVLPVVVAPLAADLLRSRADATRLTAELILWAAWAAGLVGVLAPRPLGLTVVRAASASALTLAVIGVWNSARVEVAVAVVVCLAAVAGATHPRTAEVFANGAAYGDERRIPLRHPALHRLVLGPLAALLVATGIVGGPLLLAGGQWLAGTGLVAVGWPVAALLSRSLHALSRRWLVLVPGGLVVHDPLVLASPVLLPKELIVRVAHAEAPSPPIDFVLPASGGMVIIDLAEPVSLPVVASNRRHSQLIEVRRIGLAPARSQLLFDRYARPRRAPSS